MVSRVTFCHPSSLQPPMIAQQLLSSGVVPDPPEKDQIRYDTHRPPMTMYVVRDESFDSCHPKSVTSNATGSSTRSHRRCRVEISSVLFGTPEGYSDHATERVEIFAKNPSAIRSRLESLRTPEIRGPGSDHFEHSSCARILSDDNLGSATSKVKQERGKHQGSTLGRAGSVVDLIRQLSFSPSVSSSSAKETASPLLQSSPRVETFFLDNEEHRVLPAPMSPPLPPKITRLNLLEINLFPKQVTHSRNRTRSTSVSEMSESFINELVDTGDDVSFRSSSRKFNVVVEEKSLITIDNYAPSGLNLAPRPPSSLWSRALSSTFASDQSSYVSPCSSDDLTIHSCGEGEETEHVFDHDDIGHLSIEDVECSASSCDSEKVLRPRLNSESLRQWNTFCEKEESKRESIIQDQLIFKGITYLNETKDNSLHDQKSAPMNCQYNDYDSVDSGLLFSYTNSGSSSRSYKDQDEVISDLDFDMGFKIFDSLLKSSVDISMDGVDQWNMSHRRTRSSRSQLGKPLGLSRRFKSDGSIPFDISTSKLPVSS